MLQTFSLLKRSHFLWLKRSTSGMMCRGCKPQHAQQPGTVCQRVASLQTSTLYNMAVHARITTSQLAASLGSSNSHAYHVPSQHVALRPTCVMLMKA